MKVAWNQALDRKAKCFFSARVLTHCFLHIFHGARAFGLAHAGDVSSGLELACLRMKRLLSVHCGLTT
jgi:hypothetical protein